MSKPDLLKAAALPLKAAALALAVALCAQGAWGAQSGRKGQKSPSPAPSEPEAQGESESGPPKRDASKKPDALVSFVVMRGDEMFTMVDPSARDDVPQVFLRRLGQSQAVSVTNAGAGGRGDARTRAKGEMTAYVVFFQMEEEGYGAGAGGRVDSRRLVIRTYVYAPKTGDLKFTDTVYQRPYRPTARVGGIPLPVPTRGIERYPSQRELEQAASDAADRLLARFQIRPTDN